MMYPPLGRPPIACAIVSAVALTLVMAGCPESQISPAADAALDGGPDAESTLDADDVGVDDADPEDADHDTTESPDGDSDAPPNTCLRDSDCDDAVHCTIDVCDTGTGSCFGIPSNDYCSIGEECSPVDGCIPLGICSEDRHCDDLDFCNGLEICNRTTWDCEPGSPVECEDGDICTVDECDESSDLCRYRPLPDADDDGYCAAIDCDEHNPLINPAARERCDLVDNNCDGSIDDGCACVDGEVVPCGSIDPSTGGFLDEGECQVGHQACVEGAWGACEGAISPTAESCNGLDDDCDGETDELGAEGETTFYRDADDDGVGRSSESISACVPPDGFVASGGDCDDENATVHPGADDSPCDGLDQDCDGTAMCDVCTEAAHCADGMHCNGDELCDVDTGSCLSGTPVACDDEIDCTVDGCDEDTDACRFSPDDTSCEEGQACDPTEGCTSSGE